MRYSLLALPKRLVRSLAKMLAIALLFLAAPLGLNERDNGAIGQLHVSDRGAPQATKGKRNTYGESRMNPHGNVPFTFILAHSRRCRFAKRRSPRIHEGTQGPHRMKPPITRIRSRLPPAGRRSKISRTAASPLRTTTSPVAPQGRFQSANQPISGAR